ncbi:GntR family transcriptional regulator [Streptomyces sp. NPDC002896]|uniref:GntR family transcriptional regulator n=1 Tax=Streptomyces sp. NPDC002896 TaxID=3154438 RepID=UPI0033300EBD
MSEDEAAVAEGPLPPPGMEVIRQRSGEKTAQYIRRLIFDGRLRQGDRVPQDDIARALGVSRLPVREALLSLEQDGWVTIRPHRGAFIAPLDATVVADHYALYGLMHGFAARRAAARISTESLARLRELSGLLAAENDPEAFARLSLEFDRLVRGTASSARLRSLLRAMVGLIPGNFFALVSGAIEVERAGSAAIVEALSRRDGETASEAYAGMLRRQGELVVRLFTERGLFAPEYPDAHTEAAS